MAITIYDIARKANLSHSAVSMALRGASGISEATRVRVQLLADEMGYRPNASARNLKSAETRMISAVVPLDQRMPMEIITRVQGECEANGYQVLWQNLPPDAAGCRQMLERLCQGYSDATIMMLYDFEPVADLVEKYLRSSRPLVVFGAPGDMQPMEGLLPIYIDNTRAVRSVTEMLISQGHRRIVHICPARSGSPDSRSHRTIVETMRKHGIDDVNPKFCIDFPEDSDLFTVGAGCADQLLKTRPDVTAVECPNDIFAIGLIRRFSERGVRVPEDVSVVGSDNTVNGNFSMVRLTSIDMKYREAASRGCRLLCEQLTGRNWSSPPQPLQFQAEVVLRDSTGPAPKEHRGNNELP